MPDTTPLVPIVSDERLMAMSILYQSDEGEDDGPPMTPEDRCLGALLHLKADYESHRAKWEQERTDLIRKLEWISLNDEFPEDEVEVLVRGYAWNDPERGYWHDVMLRKAGQWFESADDLYPTDKYEPVDWMHLPSTLSTLNS